MYSLRKIAFMSLKVLLIAALSYYVLKDVQFSVFMQEVSTYSLGVLGIVMLILLCVNLVMSARWVLISHDTFRQSLESVLVSATMNILLPARLGEVAKAIYLKRYYGKSFNRSLTFVIYERFFDLFFLVAGAVFVLYFYVENPFYEKIFVTIFLLQLLLFILLKYYSRPFFWVARMIPVRFVRVYIKKAITTIARKIEGRIFFYTLITTLLVWLVNFCVTFIFLRYGAGFELSITDIFTVFIITGVGYAFPLLPAGALTFQASYVFALGQFDIGQSEALAASIVFHVVFIITMLIPGKLVILLKPKKTQEQEREMYPTNQGLAS